MSTVSPKIAGLGKKGGKAILSPAYQTFNDWLNFGCKHICLIHHTYKKENQNAILDRLEAILPPVPGLTPPEKATAYKTVAAKLSTALFDFNEIILSAVSVFIVSPEGLDMIRDFAEEPDDEDGVPRVMIPDDEMTSEWYDRFVPDSLWRNAMAAWIETTDIAIFRIVQGGVSPWSLALRRVAGEAFRMELRRVVKGWIAQYNRDTSRIEAARNKGKALPDRRLPVPSEAVHPALTESRREDVRDWLVIDAATTAIPDESTGEINYPPFSLNFHPSSHATRGQMTRAVPAYHSSLPRLSALPVYHSTPSPLSSSASASHASTSLTSASDASNSQSGPSIIPGSSFTTSTSNSFNAHFTSSGSRPSAIPLTSIPHPLGPVSPPTYSPSLSSTSASAQPTQPSTQPTITLSVRSRNLSKQISSRACQPSLGPETESESDEDEDEKAKEEASRKRLMRKRMMIRRGKQRASTKRVASEEFSDEEVVDEVDEERLAKKGKKRGRTSATTAKGSKSRK